MGCLYHFPGLLGAGGSSVGPKEGCVYEVRDVVVCKLARGVIPRVNVISSSGAYVRVEKTIWTPVPP